MIGLSLHMNSMMCQSLNRTLELQLGDDHSLLRNFCIRSHSMGLSILIADVCRSYLDLVVVLAKVGVPLLRYCERAAASCLALSLITLIARIVPISSSDNFLGFMLFSMAFVSSSVISAPDCLRFFSA